MKKKLFVLALIVTCNFMFMFAFGTLDTQGKISDLLNEVKLANAADQLESQITEGNLRQPMPKPRKPKDPPPEEMN